jgi:hypothetical protein
VLPHTMIPALTHILPAAPAGGARRVTRLRPLDANHSAGGTGDRPRAGRAEA